MSVDYLTGKSDKPNGGWGKMIDTPDLGDLFVIGRDSCRGANLRNLVKNLAEGVPPTDVGGDYWNEKLTVAGGVSENLQTCMDFSCRGSPYGSTDALDLISAVFIAPTKDVLAENPGAHEVHYTKKEIAKNEDLFKHLLGAKLSEYRLRQHSTKDPKRLRNEYLDQAYRYLNEMEIVREDGKNLRLPKGTLALRVRNFHCEKVEKELREKGEIGEEELSRERCMRHINQHIDDYLDQHNVTNVENIAFLRCYHNCESDTCELDAIRRRRK